MKFQLDFNYDRKKVNGIGPWGFLIWMTRNAESIFMGFPQHDGDVRGCVHLFWSMSGGGSTTGIPPKIHHRCKSCKILYVLDIDFQLCNHFEFFHGAQQYDCCAPCKISRWLESPYRRERFECFTNFVGISWVATILWTGATEVSTNTNGNHHWFVIEIRVV